MNPAPVIRAQLDVLTGARAGAVLFFSGKAITVGRHPESDLQFDPAVDLAVSTHHALLYRIEDRWAVRDLGSRNGTFVNGERLEGDRILATGDQLTFGVEGPQVQFRPAPVVPAGARTGPIPVGGIEGFSAPEHSTSERLRLHFVRQTQRLRWMAVLLSVALLVVIVLLMRMTRGAGTVPPGPESAPGEMGWSAEAPDRERDEETVPSDGPSSLHRIQAGTPGVALAVADTPSSGGLPAGGGAETGDFPLSADVVGGEEGTDSARLRSGGASPASPDLAPPSDVTPAQREIAERNRRAVVRLWVEFENGEVVRGTGFAVRANGTLITNRHVALDRDGRVPTRMAVQFTASDQIFPGRLILASPSDDLALIRVDNIVGSVPVVAGFAEVPPQVGSAVLSIGFPATEEESAGSGGAEDRADGSSRIARPILSPGMVESSSPAEIRIRGSGAVGASGSPIFDADGLVAAILFGGIEEPDGHRILALPTTGAERLLRTVGDPTVR